MHVVVNVKSDQSMDGKKVLGVLLKALEAEYKVQFQLHDTQVSASGAQNQMAWEISSIEPAMDESPEQAEAGPLLPALPAIAIDPLESAISSTAGLIGDELGRLAGMGEQDSKLTGVLGRHLDRLLDIQSERLSAARHDGMVEAIVNDICGSRRQGM